MKSGFYYIVHNSGHIVWVYATCAAALMELTALWAVGKCGLNIVHNGAILYSLTQNGIEKIGA